MKSEITVDVNLDEVKKAFDEIAAILRDVGRRLQDTATVLQQFDLKPTTATKDTCCAICGFPFDKGDRCFVVHDHLVCSQTCASILKENQ